MHFNLSKCEHLTTVTSKHSPSSDYFLNNCHISKVSFTKDLGVTITSNLNWNIHISIINSKAHSVRGFLQRNLKQCSKAVKSKAYLALSDLFWSMHQLFGLHT